jgi:hypothetical protein
MRLRLATWLAFLLRDLVPVYCRWGPPKGFYSEYEVLRQHKVPGRVLLESQQTPKLPPKSLREACGLNQDKYQPWPVFWTLHDQARLIGKSLVRLDEQKRLSREGAFGPGSPSDPAYLNLFLPQATYLSGNWTSMVARWAEGYYHWFMDALPRLVMLPELPADTRVIVPFQLASCQLDTLRWLGLENRVRPTAEKHLTVEHYYFCSPTSMTGCYNPLAVQFLRHSFLRQADASYDSPRRFYLQRVGKFRPITNEPEVLEFFRKRGWAIVDTEQLTQAQQIRLFAGADMICAPHGAGLTNLLWCRPGCKVLELCASTFLNGVFEGLAQAVGANHRHLIFRGDPGYAYAVDLNAVAKALDF